MRTEIVRFRVARTFGAQVAIRSGCARASLDRTLKAAKDNKKEMTMIPQNYSSSVTAKVTPEQAFERISRVPDWWTKGFTGAAQKVGDAFTVRFGKTLRSSGKYRPPTERRRSR